MLVLTRQRGEAIQIDGSITIVVVEIRGDKVRLGIDAPKDVSVFRREVWDKIKRESAGEHMDSPSGQGPCTEGDRDDDAAD